MKTSALQKQREDGCMEVQMWKFNSKLQLINDCIPVNLKLKTRHEPETKHWFRFSLNS
ncbi:hypothetical protein Hanom_Chr09g00846821 [Helianthus anomalus]